MMAHWGLILSALIIIVRMIFWPAIQARSINKLLQNIAIAISIIAGVPTILFISITATPFIILIILRNLFINYLLSKFLNNKEFYTACKKRITAGKLAIYKSYAGSMDVFLRSGTKEDKAVMNDGDWVLIDNYIHDIWLARKKESSMRSLEQLEMSIFDNCASISVATKLKMMNWEDYRFNNKKGVVNKILNWLFP